MRICVQLREYGEDGVRFPMKFSERILHRYLVYTKDLAKDQYVLMMPVFIKTCQDWQFFMRLCGKTSVFRRVLSRTCFVECSGC